MSNFLSKEQEQQMVEEYLNGTPIDSLLNKYGFKTRKSITDKVKKYYGKEKRTELINQTHVMSKRYNYTMDTISCNFDAYLLGLLLTDGYILTHDNGVGLDLTDEDVIKFNNGNTVYKSNSGVFSTITLIKSEYMLSLL